MPMWKRKEGLTWLEKLITKDKKEDTWKHSGDERTGESVYPVFIKWLKGEGYYFSDGNGWWMRVWTTAVPYMEYPTMKMVAEVYQFNLEDKKAWTYRIIRPDCLGERGGGHGANWLIWEEIGTDITQNI